MKRKTMSKNTNTGSSASIKPGARDEVVTMGFFIDFMTEFKRDLFEMLDIRFNSLEVRVTSLEKSMEETKDILERSIGQNTMEHVKFDRRIKLLEKAA